MFAMIVGTAGMVVPRTRMAATEPRTKFIKQSRATSHVTCSRKHNGKKGRKKNQDHQSQIYKV